MIKLTKAQLAMYEQEVREFNRRMKRAGRHNERLSLQQYIKQRYGQVSPLQTNRDYKPSTRYVRQTRDIPSLSDTNHVCGKPETKVYTGTLIKGIATMHKSNAVPVIDAEQAKDIARMRRG
jgi:hypothetical protein